MALRAAFLQSNLSDYSHEENWMFIRIGYEIVFDLPAPASLLLLLSVRPEESIHLCAPERLTIMPQLKQTHFLDAYGNQCTRITAPQGSLRLCSDTIIENSGVPDPAVFDAVQHPVDELPFECFPYLLASRYCEVDRLLDIAWQLFSHTAPGWGRVQAVCDWVHQNVEFGYQYARPTKTAFDVYEERRGVCRDFTHLAITFCRCLNIPARYATGYLGDIGVPANPAPMDFSACFQVYLGGEWHLFDARHNERRIGWILMAQGRDATDCAITTTFGASQLQKFIVWTEEVPTAQILDPRCPEREFS
jgi:transglutaminase-like putative cysteine protease